MSLPPPPINDKPGSFAWLEWYRQLRNYVSTSGSVPWYIINFAGSNITDIATRLHSSLQGIQGGTAGEHYHLTAAQVAGLGAGNHNDLLGIQGGAAGDRYHVTQNQTNNVLSYLNGGTVGQGWNDLLGTLNVRSIGANDPTWEVYRGNIRQYQFANTGMNEIWFDYHMQHDYKPGSDIYLHIHWSQAVVDTGGAAGAPGQVKWYFDVSYAKGHQQQAFSAPITTSITQTASGTAYMHMLGEIQLSASAPTGSQINSSQIEPDGVLLVRAYRDPTDVADTLNQAPFVHFVDIHYQTDRVNTKNKAPNFYA